MMLVERRDEQNAADAAALAGARYVLTDPVAAEAAAREIASINGYDDADANEVVSVHIPAIHGRYVGLPGFIEVEIGSTRPSIFGGVIGRATWPIGAMAVATNSQNLTFPFSMLALDPSACKAIAVSGGGVVEAYANIQSNSNGADCAPATPRVQPNGWRDDRRRSPRMRPAGSSASSRTRALARRSPARWRRTPSRCPTRFETCRRPAKPALPPPMVPVGHTDDAARELPRRHRRRPAKASPSACDDPGDRRACQRPGWILYPGLYPGGLAVSKDRTVYLMPGIYWIGGGGLDIGGGGSIVTIGTATDAKPNIADAPCAAVTTAETPCGGVLIYNSKLPASAGGPVDPQLQCGDDEARGVRRADD